MEPTTNELFVQNSSIQGKAAARKLAHTGRFISAIKLLELMNPKLSRQDAKTIVHSFGFSSEPRWPQEDVQPVRCL